MKPLLRVMDAFCAAGAAVGALACLALAAMLIVEVITTSFFQYSQPWAVEYSGYLLAATLFAGAGWTLGQGGHIRVSVLIELLPERAVRLLDLAMSVLALAIVAFVTKALFDYAWRSFTLGSQSYYPSRTPLFLPQMLLAAGWATLAVGLAARILRLATGAPPDRGAAPA